MQKSFFVVMLLVLTASVLATRTRLLIPALSYVYFFPILAMFVAFFFQWQKFSAFHAGVLVKPFMLFLCTLAFFSLLKAHFKLVELPKLGNILFIMLLLQLVLIALQIILGDIPALKIISFKKVYDGFGFRAPGSFDWVYITCYVLSFYLAYFIVELFLGTRKAIALLMIIMIFIAIFLSQSKTGYLATALLALYFSLLSITLNLGIAKKLLLLKLCFISVATFAIIQLNLNLDYIANFIELMSQGQLDGSTSTRKLQTIIAIEQGLTYWYSGSPLALNGVIIENTYLDYLFRYGLLGFISIVLLFMTCYFYSLKVCFTSRKNISILGFKHLQLSIAAHIAITSAILYGFTGTPLDASRSAIWSAFILALIAYLDHINKTHLSARAN
ncbi:hypothetical protein [Pseudoalteromonas sp. T1lg23B]|uniref:hypothetical protein n=1 Tax=Pseudoalteromonas sp. T1lg23B TaxID=2077097 RepID=UPI00131A14AB|nr:hypothetical protein [Pseudoalteromonas sp. T1lg23B]